MKPTSMKITLVFALILSGCFGTSPKKNNKVTEVSSSSSTSSNFTSSSSSSASSIGLGIPNSAVESKIPNIVGVTIIPPSSPSARPTWRITLGVGTGKRPITEICGKPALKAEWSHPVDQESFIPRVVFLISRVEQSYIFEVDQPADFEALPAGTVVELTPFCEDLKRRGNLYQYSKPAGPALPDSFADQTGAALMNIYRYTCFSVPPMQPAKIRNFAFPLTGLGSDNQPMKVLYGNTLCLPGTPQSSTSATANCPYANDPEYLIRRTSESYPHHLYVPYSQRASINERSLRYICPRVRGVRGLATNPNDPPSLYPLDTSFSLAYNKSGIFSIEVQARKFVNSDGAPNLPGELLNGPIGYAAPINADGTCPSVRTQIRTSSGNLTDTTLQLYRLRKFRTIHPPTYGSNGFMYPVDMAPGTTNSFTSTRSIAQVDEVFAIDRPVKSTGGTNLNITMLGPKPCPTALFTDRRVTASFNAPNGSYVGTNDTSVFNGRRNTSGVSFPNEDISGVSCSMTVPVYKGADGVGAISLATIHRNSNPALSNTDPDFQDGFVRPYSPYTPTWVEDTSFQACAPLSYPTIQDPPLYFTRDTTSGHIGYCAGTMPTQNNLVSYLESNGSRGALKPYTSPVVKNVNPNYLAQQTCTATLLSNAELGSGYPSTGLGHHLSSRAYGGSTEDKTCDKTTAFSLQEGMYGNIPLQAPQRAIESGIRPRPKPVAFKTKPYDTSTYGCIITSDKNLGSSFSRTPTEGCCGKKSSTDSAPLVLMGVAYPNNQSAFIEPNPVPAGGGFPAELCPAPEY